MPATTIFVLGAIVAAFTVFALTLVWAKHQTHRLNREPVAVPSRRRSF
jgi:hypothetical protein